MLTLFSAEQNSTDALNESITFGSNSLSADQMSQTKSFVNTYKSGMSTYSKRSASK